jgi:putative endonuclease
MAYYVYIITNSNNTVLYTGVTSNLTARIFHHKNFEISEDINSAIIREKQIKGGSRKKKIEIISRFNPEWKDLYSSIYS